MHIPNFIWNYAILTPIILTLELIGNKIGPHIVIYEHQAISLSIFALKI